jgi:hypothetical protein
MLVIERLKDAKVVEALKILQDIIPPCELWIQMRSELMGELDSSWAADIAVYKSIPLLWALLGEICREISKKGNWEDAARDISHILGVWRRLSLTSIGAGDIDVDKAMTRLFDGVTTFEDRKIQPLVDCSVLCQGIAHQSSPITRSVRYLLSNIPELSPAVSSMVCNIAVEDYETIKSYLGDGTDIHLVTVYCFVWSMLFYNKSSQFLSLKGSTPGEITGFASVSRAVPLNFCPEDSLEKVKEILKDTRTFKYVSTPNLVNHSKDQSKALRCLRQLGDACNALAKMVLSTVGCDFKIASTSSSIKPGKQEVTSICLKKMLYVEDFLNISLTVKN